jgi:hypothetical protein
VAAAAGGAAARARATGRQVAHSSCMRLQAARQSTQHRATHQRRTLTASTPAALVCTGAPCTCTCACACTCACTCACNRTHMSGWRR